MDVYTILDLLAISAAACVFWKTKTRESLLLLAFFAMTTATSELVVFASQSMSIDLTIVYIDLFVGFAVLFGLLSKSHPIVLGYIAYLGIIGINALETIAYYSAGIYFIYAMQLMMVFYVRNTNTNNNWVGFFNSTHS